MITEVRISGHPKLGQLADLGDETFAGERPHGN
jgi:hypothetical protein